VVVKKSSKILSALCPQKIQRNKLAVKAFPFKKGFVELIKLILIYLAIIFWTLLSNFLNSLSKVVVVTNL